MKNGRDEGFKLKIASVFSPKVWARSATFSNRALNSPKAGKIWIQETDWGIFYSHELRCIRRSLFKGYNFIPDAGTHGGGFQLVSYWKIWTCRKKIIQGCVQNLNLKSSRDYFRTGPEIHLDYEQSLYDISDLGGGGGDKLIQNISNPTFAKEFLRQFRFSPIGPIVIIDVSN